MIDDHEEILRLRQRLHDLANTVTTIELRVAGVQKKCDALEVDVAAMMEEDKIAAAVAARLRRDRSAMFSFPIKLAAFLVALSAVADFVLRVTHV